MSQKALDRDLAAVIRQITDRYITIREGTPAHIAKTQLGKKRELLEQADRDGYLRYTGPKYFPRFLALDLEDSDTRKSVEQCTTLVLKSLKAIYERDGDTMCAENSIMEMSKRIDSSASPEAVRVGMLFATDFPHYVHLWNVSPENEGLNLAASDRLLDFDDLTSAWKRELKNRANATASAVAPRNTPSEPASTLLGFETAGETYTSEGIEGEGGTARVFRVVDSTGNRWALKYLKPEQVTAKRTKRFLNELNFCRDFSHANVVQVIDNGFVVQGGTKCPFYVMPLHSSTLRKLLKAGLHPEKVLRYFADMLNGVEAAHLKGVWHRDLKPENILHELSEDKLLVTDFGIAHFTSEQLYTTVKTRPAEQLANFRYAAPEQRQHGANVDHRADIYALGLILNEMFTGQVLQGVGYKLIGQVAPQFAYLDAIVEQMAQQAPENRPGSIDEIKRTLMAKGNEFISRQKLDTLQQTVVPSSVVTHPFVHNPVKVIACDISGDTMVAKLNIEPPRDWLGIFAQQRVYTFVQGAEPANWNFTRDEARVRVHPRHLELEAQMMLDYLKQYVQSANTTYLQHLEFAVRQREADQRRTLQEEIAQEQRRQRIISKLKI
ncbi:MAG TPA: serine/threonine-protein kinase [Candidatus Acidoferrum sp.]|nr:serine/threonine-protein kinase [Candidatus Acidoferrum sp.]